MKLHYRNNIILILSACCMALCGWQCKSAYQEKQKNTTPPNLVVILVDDMGYADAGFNGCEDIPTPGIDKIARQGVVFTNGYVSYAVCGPSRAGLITGRYQDRFGFCRNPLFAPNDPDMGLPVTEETLSDALNQAGYKSVAIGKWHLGAHPSQRPLQRGFSDFFGFLTGGHRYFPEEWTLEDEYAVNSQNDAYRTKLLRNNDRIEENEYLTDALSREAVNYIEKYKDDPFFIYLAYNAPHTPLQATDKYLDRFNHIQEKKRKTYAAMVSAVDDGVGLILDKLNELDLHDNTMVVFLSDNGGPEPVNASDNGPLKGKKGDLWEGGIRVPFAMQWPDQIAPGSVYENPVISLDIFATMASINNLKTKHELDGVNLLPFLQNKNTDLPHPELFWRKFDQKSMAVRQGNRKYVISQDSHYLYDLNKDIGESENLAVNQENGLSELSNLYKQWNSAMQDPIFLGLRHNKQYNELHPDRFDKKIDNNGK